MVQRRQRRAAGSSDAAIGASEFATALNNSGGGDNSAVVLNALRRFAKTVRRQRRLALSSSEHVVPADGPDELASEEDLIATDSDSELEEEEETDIDEIDDDDELVPMKGGNGTAPPKPSRIPNTQPAKKRYKRDEAWKEDSASYNVPFVGTAAFVQRDRVVRGEWPTGLLQAYLAKSPLAVELTATTMGETKKDLDAHAAAVGSDKKKKGNAALKDDNTITKNNKQKMLSQAIQKAHLVALSELLTAAIPIDTLRRHLQRDGSLAVATTASSSNENNTPESTWQPPRFVSQVVALRLPGILRSLADETGHGKGKSGLAAKYGGCGPLAAPALTILTRLCEIQEPPSAAVAAPFLSIIRHVARSLEQDLPDGVLRFLVAAPQPRTHQQQHHHSSEMSANPLPNSDGEMTAAAAGANSNSSVVRWKASPRIQSQIAAHMLTAALTEIGDSVVFSCICSSGGKVRPGLLFLALQRGLPTTGRSSGLSKYPTCIHRLPPQQLQAVRRVVLAVQDMMNRQSASKRLMLEAFSTECIQSLCCMSVGWAPTLIRFEDVLNSTDEYVNNDADTRLQEVVGKEIRRLTFSLLADSSRSPLLQAISGTNKPNQNATSSEQIIVRAMAYLIEEDGNPLEVRRFVLYTLNMAPNLLPALFRVLLLPDMARTPCQLAARLNCISFFLRQGPCAKDCLSVEGPFVAADDTIALVFVPFALKKTYFMKALQSTSALVAFEALKLYGSILARHRDFRMYHVNEKYPSQVTVVTECLVSSLPDLAMLSNALAKLNTTANAKSDVVLYAYICDVIRLYVVEFHRKFDLCKVLSTDAESFLHFPLFVQKMIVSAIQVAISTQETLSMFQVSSFRILLKVMLLTKSNWIFRHFRTLLIELLFRTFRLVRDSYPPTSNQTDNRAYDVCVGNSRSLQYFEFSCWIDGITLATVEEFGKLLLDASNCSSPLVVDVARAWQNQKVPAPLPSFKQSKVLVRALQRLGQASAEFRLLILQTVERCLLRDPSPLPMATLIVEFAENESLLMNDQMRYLLHYAKSLILFESFTGSDRRLALVQMLQSTFSKEFFPLSLLICNGCPRSKFALGREDCLDVSWQLTNFSLLLQGGDSARCMAFLRRILPITLMYCETEPALIQQLRTRIKRFFPECLMFFDVLLLSKMNRFSGEKRQTHENALSLSIICDRMTTNACDRLRFGSLFLHAVGCSLDDDSLLNVASPILKENANKSFNMVVDGPFLRLMNQCFRTEIDEQVDDPIQGVRFTSIVLHSWMELAAESDLSSFTLGLLITMECELSLHIPQGLTSFILAEHQSERFVRRAVETMTMMYQEGNDFRSRLLSSAILSDPREFVPVYCRIHDEKSLDDSYKNLFISGFLDTSLCASLDFVSGEINDITYLQSLGHQLNTRVEKSLDKSFEDPELCSLFTLIISMFPHSSLWTNLPSAPLVQLLSHLLSCEDDNSFRSVERFSESTISRALEVAAHVCDMGPQTTNLKMGQLKMTVSTFVCRSLPRVLRVSTDSCHRSFAIRLLSIFQSMVVRTISHAKNALNLTVRSSVTHCVRACLRFGMKEDGFGNSVVASSCLGAVKTFAKSLVADSLPLNIAASTSRNNMAAETFNMVTSHSQFDNIIQSRNNDDRKLEIVQILENCLLALPQVEFETAVWKSLLVGFTAGVTIIDNNVRLLLCMYGSHTKPNSYNLSLNQLRWGDPVHRLGVDDQWQWLVESIELERVYATIANFPSKDSTTLKFCKLSANECKPESIESPDKRVISCYSPGFLLPLILAAMQSEASETLTRSKGSPVWNLATFSSKGGSGTLLSHRLYEKGALALALVSLSCECPNVRKLSIAIIGMYLEVLDSELARKSTSWRERPQIAMILNGVQRALVIRHAEEIGEGNSFELLLVVPALPGFSAVFLARASLILGRSSDTLFIAMNRAFLQTETDCGSFRDLTRLPAFMALFCSSTDEAQRLSSERNFALELVKDGLYDEESYRLLISCHCPELILDSIMNADALTSFDSRDEIPLIFTVLSKMITVGGERAASHLLIRVGLLTFLRSILVDHLLLRNYPSHVEFLELLSVAAAKTADLIPASDFEAATSGVGESALSLLLGTVNKKSSELSARSKILLCQLLSTLTRGVDSVVDVPPLVFMKEFNKNGIKLETAIAFISINHSPSNLRSCVHSICSLPVMCEPEDASLVEEFCVLVLRTEKSTIHGDVRFIETAFRRISFLVSEVDLSFSRKANVIQNVLPWFSTVRSQNQTLAAWQTCLAILVADQVAEQQVSLTDVSHVTDLASWVVNNHRISSHVRL